jgi:hypothetical protein
MSVHRGRPEVSENASLGLGRLEYHSAVTAPMTGLFADFIGKHNGRKQ